jgi:hypothetical protein
MASSAVDDGAPNDEQYSHNLFSAWQTEFVLMLQLVP